MIEVKNVSMHYGKFCAVSDLSFKIETGEIVAFIGPNGAGKTTTMRIITGFMSPSFGDVFINGKDVFEEKNAIQKDIGYLPEKPPLYPNLTVTEYLQFVGELKRMDRKAIKTRIDEVLELTSLTNRRNTLIAFLSKGLKQRVGIAQSIINSPKVLVLDEPTVGLDPQQVLDIRHLMNDLAKQENRTIILSTHILAEAAEICSKAIIINDGKIVAVDTIEEIKKNTTLQTSSVSISLEVLRDAKRFVDKLKTHPEIQNAAVGKGNIIIVSAKKDVREDIAKMAVQENAGIIALQMKVDSLEDAFIKMVK